MELWHIWIVAGIALLVLEIFTPGFVLAAFGIACLGCALVAGMGGGVAVQLLVFTVLTLTVFFGVRPMMKRYFERFDDPRKLGVEAMIGKTGKVTEAIGIDGDPGRIKIGGESWRAFAQDDAILNVGETVAITKIDGATAIVAKLGKGE